MESFEKLELLNRTLEKTEPDRRAHPDIQQGGNQRLTSAISYANRYTTPLSMVLFDIDYCKVINDTHGHLAGDTVLKELAGLIQDNVRQSDLHARWGGEEFVVLVSGVDRAGALQFAEKLRLLVEKFRFSVKQNITCSFGISSFIPPKDDHTFLQRVDEALYQAKQGGRNKCVLLEMYGLPLLSLSLVFFIIRSLALFAKTALFSMAKLDRVILTSLYGLDCFLKLYRSCLISIIGCNGLRWQDSHRRQCCP